MELIARFFCGLTVYAGWFASPVYSLISFRSSKPLPRQKQPDILNLSATELARKIRNKEVTPEIFVFALYFSLFSRI